MPSLHSSADGGLSIHSIPVAVMEVRFEANSIVELAFPRAHLVEQTLFIVTITAVLSVESDKM
jgi:hypothetical protein